MARPYLELSPQGIFTCLSSISTCGLCLVQMPGWAPVPWQVPRTDKSTASPMVRLPPDLGHPRLPARPSFPVLAKLGAWPSCCPRCLGMATAHWARIAVPCLGHTVLPGVGSAACLIHPEGAPFGVYLGGSLNLWAVGRFKMCPWVWEYLWVWRLLTRFGSVPRCGSCRYFG